MKSVRNKWHWPELKLEFFRSNFAEVKGFFQEQYDAPEALKESRRGYTGRGTGT